MKIPIKNGSVHISWPRLLTDKFELQPFHCHADSVCLHFSGIVHDSFESEIGFFSPLVDVQPEKKKKEFLANLLSQLCKHPH